jgi:hypothetical protein
MANRFNTWYDGLKEPWKILTALGLSMPVIVLMATGAVSFIILGFIFAVLLICVRAEAA